MYGDEFILALTIWREARGEGIQGMTAVGCVVRNRTKTQAKSFYEICLGPNQFSSMTVHGDPETTTWPGVNDSQWGFAQKLAQGLILNTVIDTTGGALYYENPSTASSPWFTENIKDKPKDHPLTAVIGKQYFYR